MYAWAMANLRQLFQNCYSSSSNYKQFIVTRNWLDNTLFRSTKELGRLKKRVHAPQVQGEKRRLRHSNGINLFGLPAQT